MKGFFFLKPDFCFWPITEIANSHSRSSQKDRKVPKDSMLVADPKCGG